MWLTNPSNSESSFSNGAMGNMAVFTLCFGKISVGPNSTWRPGHVASAENVDVQVRHGFTAVRAIVDDEPVAVLQTQLLRDFGGLEQNVSEQLSVVRLCLGDPWNGFLRKNQNMHRRLRVDVAD